MAHGFGAERAFGLEPYAERFAAAGMAVFAFDYRCFGASQGHPRNLVNPFRHLNDWKAALTYARGLPGVDASRIGLWGSSFSGGHVLVTAARDKGVSAVVSQVPFVDGVSTSLLQGTGYILRAVAAGLRDITRLLTFREPYYIPLACAPEVFGAMNTPDAYPGYLALVPEGHPHLNACPARALILTTLYRPGARAKQVRCPALVVLAEKDSLISTSSVEKTVSRLPLGELMRMPIGHFEVYSGEPFEEAVNREAGFLAEHLRA
jgi:pimeloyl-ACP methyl ester carboxylesterase